ATVLTGRQVAIAAPTTVLARQHADTFRTRFSRLGFDVGELSRFVSPAEARAAKQRLGDGSLKLVVGTQAIAAKGVRFKELGLVVIDEEQRFGLADKAKLAQLGTGAHLLTLSATPIPRTVSQAYAGIRPISVIATAPARRIPVKTVVGPFHDAVVATAFRREHRRRGQSFLVCPRVEDIAGLRHRLEHIVPELKMTVIHGKMPPREIDLGMTQFAERKSDILLATNIIESGLDIPRANTMVVWRPDRFGLAQLHQLRGRVGRGSTPAFALFLTDPDAKLSDAARKRLEILHEFSRPGAGLAISYGDMDLRGGGDLLSERQSGHLNILGPALFRRMVERTLRPGGGGADLTAPRPQLQLGIAASLPADFIKDDATRLEIYARVSKCESLGELDELEDLMFERFGELPGEALALLELGRIELECLRLGVTAITAGPHSLAATLTDSARRPLTRKDLRWKDQRLLYRRQTSSHDRLEVVREFLELIED
ncbi:MAG: helicase-related protein, partial [Solirubrobacterales bacterium]